MEIFWGSFISIEELLVLYSGLCELFMTLVKNDLCKQL